MNNTLLILLFLVVGVFGEIKPNNAFRAFFWTMNNSNDTVKNGCYGYTQVDSISSTETDNRLKSSFWLTYEWWHLRFKMSYMPTEVKISKTKPAAITRSPNHFVNTPWFSGFKRTDSPDSIVFYFPMLLQTQNYGRYDYFTVDVDSLCDLEFYGAGDSIFVGTFVHKKPDARGAVNILGRNAFIVELTKANPFRIKSLRCNGAFDSLISKYLKFPLDSLKKDAAWYGVDILDTLNTAPKIRVFSVALKGTEPFLRETTKDVTWKLDGKSEIDSCLVSVSFDKMSWVPIGKTALDTLYPWFIPRQASDTTILKVIACGKHGERIEGVKSDIKFIYKAASIWGLQVH